MNWTRISQQIPQPTKRWDLFLVAIATLSISVEIFFQANGASTLDWNDWLFWAKQNYEQMIASRDPFSLVISPVQGLFGLSYPLNPFLNPLWLIAVLVDDSILAHRITTAIVFVLMAMISISTYSLIIFYPFLVLPSFPAQPSLTFGSCLRKIFF